MKRREFIAAGASSVALAFLAYAQKLFTVGYLGNSSTEDAPDWFAGFRQGLKENGFTVGENVGIEYRPTHELSRFAEIANDLVRNSVDVIFAEGNTAALAAKAATSAIPIVFAIGGDPVALGLVASINRPGGNVTGVSFLSTTIMAKRLELFHEAIPSASTIAALINPGNANAQIDLAQLEKAACDLDLQLQIVNASTEAEIDEAFSKLAQTSAKALVVEGDGRIRRSAQSPYRTCGPFGHSDDAAKSRDGQGRWTDGLWSQSPRCLPCCWRLRRSHSQRRKTSRTSGTAVHKGSVHCQSQDGKST
jgi:putative tryptophan/tyrosine transport system substrate-binding protein